MPMDIAPESSGTVAGLMNVGSASAALLSPVVAGYLSDKTGNWDYPFIGSMVLLTCGMLLVFRMKPSEHFVADTPVVLASAT